MGCKAFFLGGCALAVFGMGVSMPALAQSAKDEDQVQAEDVFNEGDIIVTARRRVETAQETPVALTVLNEALLDRYAVKNISSIVSLTPGLVTSEASGAMGGTISLRGVGSGDSMAFIDQAVSANVDGATTMAGFDDSRVTVTDTEIRLDWNGLSYVDGTTIAISFTFDGTAVPEPGALALLAFALGGLIIASRRPAPAGA